MSEDQGVAKQMEEAADKGPIVSAHIAEYEALMTRNTYWITIQFSTAPAIAIYFTLLTAIWNVISFLRLADGVALQKLVLWIGILGAECFVIAGYMCLYEIYNNVRYIESHLRPELDKLLPNQNYWMYERFLAKHRGLGALLNEWWIVVLVFAALLLVALYARPWGKSDFFLCLASIAVSGGIIMRATEVSKIRLRGFHDDRKLSAAT